MLDRGYLYAFFVDRTADPIVKYLKTIPAGDDPESLVFINGMVYAANEHDGTVTVASAVFPDGSGGELLNDLPVPQRNLMPWVLLHTASVCFTTTAQILWPALRTNSKLTRWPPAAARFS